MELISGIIAGIVSGLGLGGGSVLILILVNFMGMDQHMAQATNLIFFIPTAIIACIVNLRQKLIDFKLGIIVAISGLIGVVAGVQLSFNVDSNRLKSYFGIFLIIIAIYEIYGMIKEDKIIKKQIILKNKII